MTRLFTFICVLALGFLTSCQFSENIYINADGSGKMEFSFDATELMKMAGESMAQSNEKAVDSTFSFSEFFETKKDSIALLPEAERAVFEEMKDFTIRMVMRPETNEMKMSLATNFKNANELQDMFSKLNKLQSLNKQDLQQNPLNTTSSSNYSTLNYGYNGKVFKRNVTITDRELHQKMVDSLSNAADMYASSTYKLNYHFPKPIKSVSNQNATLSSDRKTLSLDYSFSDYMFNPEALNLEVILED